MKIVLNHPHKIVERKQKQYDDHYHIRSAKALVVPVRALGDEVACEVRWQDDLGETRFLDNAVFQSQNLVPINAITDMEIFDRWQKYYSSEKTDGDPLQ